MLVKGVCALTISRLIAPTRPSVGITGYKAIHWRSVGTRLSQQPHRVLQRIPRHKGVVGDVGVVVAAVDEVEVKAKTKAKDVVIHNQSRLTLTQVVT